jgi:hypothetical protein
VKGCTRQKGGKCVIEGGGDRCIERVSKGLRVVAYYLFFCKLYTDL